MRWFLIPLFALMGALIARSFFLTFIEESAFRIAWEATEFVKVDWDLFKRALRTDTGTKIATGFIIGGMAGFMSAWTVGKLRPAAKR